MTNIAVANLGHKRLPIGVYIGVAHEDGLLECINAHCWIIEPSLKKILVQKRSLQDGCFGGLYDISIAGHVDEGETAHEAIVREAKEEGGFNISSYISYKPQKIVFSENASYNNEPFVHNQQAFVFIATLSLDKIRKIHSADASEVACFKLLDFAYFSKAALSGNRNFAPHPQEYYKKVINIIKKVFEAYERTA